MHISCVRQGELFSFEYLPIPAFIFFPCLPSSFGGFRSGADHLGVTEQSGMAEHLDVCQDSVFRNRGQLTTELTEMYMPCWLVASYVRQHRSQQGKATLTSMCHLSPLHTPKFINSRADRSMVGSADNETSFSRRSNSDIRQASVNPHVK